VPVGIRKYRTCASGGRAPNPGLQYNHAFARANPGVGLGLGDFGRRTKAGSGAVSSNGEKVCDA